MKKILAAIITLSLVACGSQSEISNETVKKPETQSSRLSAEDNQIVDKIWYMESSKVDTLIEKMKSIPASEQDAFVLAALEKEKVVTESQKIKSQGYRDSISDWASLSNEERLLCVGNPSACLKIRSAATYAENEAFNVFPDGARHGRQDAFRHALWNAVMTTEISYWWAEHWSNAHESDAPNNNEREMDYYNNSVGRSASWSGASRYSLSTTIKQKLLNQQLVCQNGAYETAPLKATNNYPCF